MYIPHVINNKLKVIEETWSRNNHVEKSYYTIFGVDHDLTISHSNLIDLKCTYMLALFMK